MKVYELAQFGIENLHIVERDIPRPAANDIRMILAILLDLPLPKLSSFEIDYASVTHVELRPHFTEVRLLNFAPWRHL